MPNRKQGGYHKRRPKYNATKVRTAYGTFDSKHEYERYVELKDMQEQGIISDLETQVPYILVPKSVDRNGKVIERAARYYADFRYIDSNGNCVVEDAKGVRTPEYVLKRKIMLWRYGIQIKEV